MHNKAEKLGLQVGSHECSGKNELDAEARAVERSRDTYGHGVAVMVTDKADRGNFPMYYVPEFRAAPGAGRNKIIELHSDPRYECAEVIVFTPRVYILPMPACLVMPHHMDHFSAVWFCLRTQKGPKVAFYSVARPQSSVLQRNKGPRLMFLYTNKCIFWILVKIRLCLQEDEAHIMGELTRKRRRTLTDTTSRSTLGCPTAANKDAFIIVIKMPSGSEITVCVTRKTMVSQLMSKIQDFKGIPVNQQRLWASDRRLDAGARLGEYLDKGVNLDIIDLLLEQSGC